MAVVEFSKDNAMKCMCSTCPVQAASSCVADKNAKLAAAMTSGMEGMPAADEVAGVYCATGVASCDDLDLSMGCVCSTCAVFADNQLGQWKYCERGNAASIG